MELSPEEVEAVEVSRRPTTVITANESIDTTDVKDAEMFVTVWLVEDTPAVLSTGKLFEENEVFLRMERRKDTESYKNCKVAPCTCDNFVPIVDPDSLSDTNILRFSR